MDEVLQLRPFISAWKGEGFEVVLVSRDSSASLSSFVDRNELDEIAVLLDERGEVWKLYRISGLPETIFIDRNGTVRYISPGWGRGSLEEYRKWVDTLTKKERD